MSEPLSTPPVEPAAAPAGAVAAPAVPAHRHDGFAAASGATSGQVGSANRHDGVVAASCVASGQVGSAGAVATVGAPSAVVAELTAWVARLGALPDAVDDAERIDRIAVLERLRGAVAAAQARETSGFADSQAAARAAAGLPERLHGRGVAEQVGLARGMSPAAAARQVGFAAALRDEVPAVAELLRRGQISEW
ncbi:MAG TPA: DUF222 domain-containing protein, partial [Kribbellaceae bacterium]|nr:DUF222 domain-containing protein [Kribbellaceae bacterium]